MARRIRPLGIAVVVALLALFALLPAAGAAPRAQETENVGIRDFKFDPATVTIAVGDTVVWTNNDQAPHTATAVDKSFDTGRLDNGQQGSVTFDRAGTFQYVCTFHDTMTGTVVVEAEAAAAPAAPAQQAPAQQAPTGAVEAADQPVVSREITVAKVTAGQAGWIVAHLDEGGRPGRVLGQTAVPAGESTNVKIALSEDVPVGGALWPMLHIDAGTVGTYEFPGADVPVMAEGAPVMKKITVTAAGAAPAQPPAALPRTAGEELPLAVGLLAALLALLAGLALRARRA
ncbi:MAG TPA: cupredoxin family copper-binding protein [Roseiflexaceae bacterium]|nr:cupredoxin family copper-binding protein [Roseiflexaceae bacterium]